MCICGNLLHTLVMLRSGRSCLCKVVIDAVLLCRPGPAGRIVVKGLIKHKHKNDQSGNTKRVAPKISTWQPHWAYEDRHCCLVFWGFFLVFFFLVFFLVLSSGVYYQRSQCWWRHTDRSVPSNPLLFTPGPVENVSERNNEGRAGERKPTRTFLSFLVNIMMTDERPA